MTADRQTVTAVQLEATGVVMVVDDGFRVVHTSERCNGLLELDAADLAGRPLDEVIGQDATARFQGVVSDGMERAGWSEITLPHGAPAKMRAFGIAPKLYGLDLMPVTKPGTSADAAAIERVASWNEWLWACDSSTELLQAAASIARERTGFSGVWVCRIEEDGHNVVVAAAADDSPDVIGQAVLAGDVPPAQPQLRGRPVPFFVSDLSADPNHMIPGAAGLLLDGSALLRPYPDFLRRLASLGVRSTASLPLVIEGRLWGRVIAHHPSARRVPASVQAELRLLGAATSARLAELVEQEQGRERAGLSRRSLRLMRSVAAASDLVDGLTRDPFALTGVCKADGAIVSIEGRDVVIGCTLRDEVRDTLLEVARGALGRRDAPPLTSTINVGAAADVDPATAAGLLAFRLDHAATDVIVWIRREDTRPVTWVEHAVVEGAEPGTLFDGARSRREEPVGNSAPWSAPELAQAEELREAIAEIQLARLGDVRELNAELTRSNEEYDAFAHAAAHDLKAPLRGIMQTTEFFIDDTRGQLPAGTEEELGTVVRLAGRMNEMLDDLLSYAQVGRADWDPRPTALRGAVEEVVDLLGPRAEGATIEAHDATVTADVGALRQLLLNLVGNAVKYAGEAPATVEVGTCTLEQAAERSRVPTTLGGAPPTTTVLTVADRGAGIDPVHHERIFGLFHQLDPHAQGSGTGLALCRLICRRHGGDIWLTSERGRGTTFYVVAGRVEAA